MPAVLIFIVVFLELFDAENRTVGLCVIGGYISAKALRFWGQNSNLFYSLTFLATENTKIEISLAALVHD